MSSKIEVEPGMSVISKNIWLKQYIIRILIPALFICSSVATAGAQKTNLALDQGPFEVVLDPGHGGHDSGVRGESGVLEKNVTLTLAKMVASQLDDAFLVVLTRNADYAVDLIERGAIANYNSADLFISLHIGGSFLHRVSGGAIFYYEKVSGAVKGTDAGLSKNDVSTDCDKRWDCLQSNHTIRSRVLANLIKERLAERITFWDTQVRGAPLMVLKGVDMPAVVIEIGYLTNPTDEKSFSDPKILSDIARGISDGIHRFFNKSP